MIMVGGGIEEEGEELMWSCGDVVNGGGMAVVAEKISSFTIRAADVLFRTAGFAELQPCDPS